MREITGLADGLNVYVRVEMKYHSLTSATFWPAWVDGRWFHLLR